jgi:hypothetical protein
MPERQLKKFPVVVLVLIAAASGCFRWSKSSDEWSGSSGVATPLVSNSNTSGGTGPLVIEEEKSSSSSEEEPSALKAPKQKKSAHPGSQTFCSRGNDRRTLELVTHRMGCRLSYQNHSQVETVAEASWGKKVCQQVRSHIVQKLKSAGYSCS